MYNPFTPQEKALKIQNALSRWGRPVVPARMQETMNGEWFPCLCRCEFGYSNVCDNESRVSYRMVLTVASWISGSSIGTFRPTENTRKAYKVIARNAIFRVAILIDSSLSRRRFSAAVTDTENIPCIEKKIVVMADQMPSSLAVLP